MKKHEGSRGLTRPSARNSDDPSRKNTHDAIFERGLQSSIRNREDFSQLPRASVFSSSQCCPRSLDFLRGCPSTKVLGYSEAEAGPRKLSGAEPEDLSGLQVPVSLRQLTRRGADSTTLGHLNCGPVLLGRYQHPVLDQISTGRKQVHIFQSPGDEISSKDFDWYLGNYG